MRILRIALAIAAIATARPVVAQSDYMHTIARVGNVELVNRHPFCNPFAQAYDPVWIHGEGWTMPRFGWHLMYPVANLAIAYALTKVHVPRKVAAIAAPLPLELAPHLRQAALGLKQDGHYAANVPDWAFDAWNRSLPTWALISSDHGTTRRALTIWLVGDLALSCFARP